MLLVWLMVSMAAVLAVVGYIYGKYALRKVSYERWFSKTAVFVGEEVEMVERITNRKLLPLPWIRLESMIGQGLVFGSQTNLEISRGELFQNHISIFLLRPYRRIVRRHQVTCSRRGWYRLESVTMTAGDPLGLSEDSRRLPQAAELVVYPRAAPLQELPLPSHSWLGEIAVRRWIGEDPFLNVGVREYRPGDSLNAVHWKATARTGTMQVHKKDYTADPRLVICLNMEVDENMWRNITDRERIERGITYAAAVAEHAAASGLVVRLICNGRLAFGEKQPIRMVQPAALREVLETLAKLELDMVTSMPAMLEGEADEGRKDGDYLLITCHHGSRLTEAAQRLERLGNKVEWMLIPEEGGRSR
ncbi:DUF58 domain-containing protein [Paenibacillus sp. CAA11]|uniref:DUF58 domain-containing protein n=1 Tax=Paenibacillus sp. CAA11 TaxID=1532905 RepID=UPI000D3B995D|nr:DUF58 domain-containing protein [Paenibacillus sp. CAA11]AWB43107.1 DUF58 domain-containing protein [Paenibacillus sp. CAA11]